MDLEPSPPRATFTQRVLDIQKIIRESRRGVCLEASKLKTQYYKKMKGWKKPLPVRRAESVAYILQHKKAIIYPGELLVGNFTAKRVGAQAWEDLFGALPWTVFLELIQYQYLQFLILCYYCFPVP